ncbi:MULTISPECIES: MoaD family protein [Aeromicrobium]|jgi:molybdopterin synthase sulfur carrier subunit|uniref:MoaD family protein n=2 Tax=Aeromicrobium TaxID=2040 RepID=A0A838XLJ5_9ACTN|nr:MULTISPECIES: MoaD family protein [Aeromicrobium]MBA4609486.1 MoaD family protein [Aeromicrobium phoceense]SKB08751.1 molybdopterin synthase subunit MoaD [Aeromicrobium choanae]
MAVEVRIPTILRPYTGGERAVDAEGATLSALIDDLEANHEGIKERLLDGADLRRFVNVYVNDEDVRFTGGLQTELSDGDTVVILPAVAGGAA